ANAPDASRAVICNVKVSMKADRDAYRPAPNLAFFGDEASQEILVTAVRLAVTHRDANNVVAGSNRAVPGAVLGCKGATVIFLWKLPSIGIEGHLKRSHMRLDDDVRSNDLRGKTDTLTILSLLGRERGGLGIGTSTVRAWFRKSWILVTAH